MVPRLSICIATYNRASIIGATLESIVSQATDEIEVVIVDGASSDNTADVVHAYADRCSQIRYLRLSEKGGVDRDFSHAVAEARGEYCWLFADDDIIGPGGIRAVMSEFTHGYELIIVNAEVRNIDMTTIIEERRLPIFENKLYPQNRFSDFFRDNVVYMTFIGSVVMQRKVWNERQSAPYYGTEFVHLGVIFQQPFRSNILVLAEPFVSIRLGNAQWTTRAFEIWMFKLPALIWSFDNVSDDAKRRITPKAPWRQWARLMWLRAEGNYSVREYKDFVAPKVSSVLERVMLKSIALIPGQFLNALALVYWRIRFSDKLVVRFSLTTSRYYWRSTVSRLFGG